jgi:hypothetical protein
MSATTVEILPVIVCVATLVVFVWQMADYRYRLLPQLDIEGEVDTSMEELKIKLTNVASRPITLSYLAIAYGATAPNAKTLVEVSDKLPNRKLTESQSWKTSIARARLVEARRGKAIEQDRYGVLWLIVSTTTRRRLSREVRFIVDGQPCKWDELWQSTSSFLGFPQIEKGISPRGYVEVQWK